MYDTIINIDAAIEEQRSIEHCGPYARPTRRKTKATTKLDSCKHKPCNEKCTFEMWVTCANNESYGNAGYKGQTI